MSTAASVTCPACGELTPAAGRFCIHCGAGRQQTCSACGEPLVAGARFCMQCGTQVQDGSRIPAADDVQPVSERRLVSVLFADLVGFTTLSEHRDPEEVRELLSRYFDRCRTLIERYGGTVEKFIGDAVMAVWGTPVAREDDPERAVRAALALTAEVTSLGEEVGMPALRVRAGVLTGNAAVEVGAEGEGMVLGDTVNTAARLQSVAEPGSVLVDDVTRRASEAAIDYEDAGSYQVKGREQPVHAWKALRVVAGMGGARRASGLEAPFVGRGHELQQIIQAADDSAQTGKACHVAVVGEAGTGKSRLLWEFFKYIDGIEELRWWHQGRCLSYGEGVAYWALAEMVRSRARIQEEDEPPTARQKLRDSVEQLVPDERERRLVEPRLAHLLRLEERPEADRADLFSGWRLFFERMANESPVVLAFEDLQWADSGLLDFIDYLLEWSADFPIFVLTLARPELRERRPGWDALTLAPLEAQSITGLLEGLAPGLPDELVIQIVRRSEGIPLYAVETIRMLQDRGLLVQEGSRYTLAGEVADLEVPETLHALVASRLDGLSAAERSLLQDASVLGQSFTAIAAAALSGESEDDVTPLLDALVLKQILSRDDDPRSPERGQYVFLQGLLRTVAYGTLSRRARKTKHVAAAHHLEQTWPGEQRDIAEVLAAHYQEAIAAEPEASDVGELRGSAREQLTTAGQAAASLALGPEARRYFEHAAELADNDLDRAVLFEQAGRALWQSGDAEGADSRLRHAIELYGREGRADGGGATLALAELLQGLGRVDEARTFLQGFRDPDQPGVDPVTRAQALAQLGVLLMLSAEGEEAAPVFDDALTILELEQAWPALAAALVRRGAYLVYTYRLEEGTGVLRQALALAEKHDLPGVAGRALFNLAAVSLTTDQYAEAIDHVNQGLALARELGDRAREQALLSQLAAPLSGLGRWDELTRIATPLLQGPGDSNGVTAAAFLARVAAARGDEATLNRCLELAAPQRDSTYVDMRMAANLIFARDAIERGDPGLALKLARDALGLRGTGVEFTEEAYAHGIESALALGDLDAIVELDAYVAGLPPARATPLLRAGRARLAAEIAHRRGEPEASSRLEEDAMTLLQAVGARPLLAAALLDRARRLIDGGALAEARAIYSELGAARWLARIDQASEVTA